MHSKPHETLPEQWNFVVVRQPVWPQATDFWRISGPKELVRKLTWIHISTDYLCLKVPYNTHHLNFNNQTITLTPAHSLTMLSTITKLVAVFDYIEEYMYWPWTCARLAVPADDWEMYYEITWIEEWKKDLLYFTFQDEGGTQCSVIGVTEKMMTCGAMWLYTL